MENKILHLLSFFSNILIILKMEQNKAARI